jgi:hypothetical protein
LQLVGSGSVQVPLVDVTLAVMHTAPGLQRGPFAESHAAPSAALATQVPWYVVELTLPQRAPGPVQATRSVPTRPHAAPGAANATFVHCIVVGLQKAPCRLSHSLLDWHEVPTGLAAVHVPPLHPRSGRHGCVVSQVAFSAP